MCFRVRSIIIYTCKNGLLCSKGEKNMRKRKRGFTIVELVITIAVIGVLSAILIPTFINLNARANEVSDDSLVANLNKALIGRESEVDDEPNSTMQDAVDDLEQWGFNLSQLVTKSHQNLLWNSKNNRFILSDKLADDQNKTGAKDVDYWQIFQSMPGTQKHSIYAGKWTGEEQTIDELHVGFDAGDNTFTSISYVNDGDGQDVVIRTNGGTLTIGSSTAVAEGKITHYGSLEEAIVYTTNNSFHTHGKISSMDLKAGKAVAEDKGYVALVKASEGTVVEEKDTGVFYIPSNAVVADIDTTVAASIGYVSNGETTPSYVVDVTTAKGQERAQTLASNAYEIDNKFDLIAFRDAVNNGQDFSQIKVLLTNDIDMIGYEWLSPIGTQQKPFIGTFDGQNHSILNLSNAGKSTKETFTSATSQTTGKLFGLFGYVSGTVTIANIKLSVNAVDPNGEAWGGLIGSSAVNGKRTDLTVSNVTILEGSTISGKKKVGGIIGQGSPYNSTEGSIKFIDCKNYANVSATDSKVAGIAGGLGSTANTKRSDIQFIRCENHGTITLSSASGDAYIAGICGWVGAAQNAHSGKIYEGIDNITMAPFIYEQCVNDGELVYNGIKYNLFRDCYEVNAYVEYAKASYYGCVGEIDGHKYDWQTLDTHHWLVGIAYSD